MSEAQREKKSLRQHKPHDQRAGRLEHEWEIAEIRRNARCVRRAAGLMAILTALAVAGLGYPTILLENFPGQVPTFIMNAIYALGVGSLISLVAFAGLGVVYRKRLNRMEAESRRMAIASLRCLPESNVGDRKDGTAQVATEADGPPLSIKSTIAL